MDLWYITVFVITTLTPSQGWMQYSQGFKDYNSCITYLEQPGIKKMVEKDLKFQTSKILIELGEYTCMPRSEVIEKNTRLGHGEKEV